MRPSFYEPHLPTVYARAANAVMKPMTIRNLNWQQLAEYVGEIKEKVTATACESAIGQLGCFADIEENFTYNNSLGNSDLSNLRAKLTGIVLAMFTECDSNPVVGLLQFEIPSALQKLLDRNLEPHQLPLLNDAIHCLRTGAWRPAIVSAWNAIYELVRWWIFSVDDRKAEFNSYVSSGRHAGLNEVNDYEDSFKCSEFALLDVAGRLSPALGQFTEKHATELISQLHQRNRFAHANYHNATQFRALGYVEHLCHVFDEGPYFQ